MGRIQQNILFKLLWSTQTFHYVMLPFLNEDDEHQMLLKNNRSERTPPEHGIIGSKAGLYHNVIYMKKNTGFKLCRCF